MSRLSKRSIRSTKGQWHDASVLLAICRGPKCANLNPLLPLHLYQHWSIIPPHACGWLLSSLCMLKLCCTQYNAVSSVMFLLPGSAAAAAAAVAADGAVDDARCITCSPRDTLPRVAP